MRRTLAVMVLMLGCHGDRRATEVSSPAPAPAPAPRPSASIDAAAAPGHGRLAAITRCHDAFAQIAGGVPAADVVTIYARGCADLYEAPPCHGAIVHLPDTNPADRLVAIATSCAKAYCPLLQAPPPRLCGPDPVRSGTDLEADWKELDAAILGHELGLSRETPAIQGIAGALFHSVTVRVEPVAAPPAAAPVLQLAIAIVPDHVEIRFDAHTWRLPAAPAPRDLAPVIAALQRAPHHADAEIAIAAAGDTPHGVVVTVLDALKAGGFRRLALTIAP